MFAYYNIGIILYYIKISLSRAIDLFEMVLSLKLRIAIKLILFGLIKFIYSQI